MRNLKLLAILLLLPSLSWSMGLANTSKSACELASCHLDLLPEDILINIFEHGFDLAEISRVNKEFYKIVRFIFKSRWEFLRQQQQSKQVPRIILVTLPKKVNPSYKDLRELYKFLGEKAGRDVSARPENFDISSPECLLDIDQEFLLLVWPSLSKMINLHTESSVTDGLQGGSAEEVLAWLSDHKNSSLIGRTFIWAVVSGFTNTVKVLLVTGAGSVYEPSIVLAASCGHLDVLDVLLQDELDATILERVGCSAIIAAAENRHIEVVRFLLAKGVCVTDLSGYRQVVREVIEQARDQEKAPEFFVF